MRALSVLALGLVAAAIWLTASAVAAGPPTIVSFSASLVEEETVRLSAEINPQGSATSYHFDYIPLGDYERNISLGAGGFTGATRSPEGTDAELGSGTAPLTAAQNLVGLEPETAYRYRLLAANAQGTTLSSPATFLTEGAAAPSLCEADACQPLPPEPEDPALGTLAVTAPNPPLHIQKKGKRGRRHHHKRHRHRAKSHKPTGRS